MIGLYMNNELRRTWKKVVVAHSRYYSGICLEGLSLTMKNTVRTAGGPTEIRIENLPNHSLMELSPS
jgi:hypothetical protein